MKSYIYIFILFYFTIIINLYIVLKTLRHIMSIVMNPWVYLLFHFCGTRIKILVPPTHTFFYRLTLLWKLISQIFVMTNKHLY